MQRRIVFTNVARFSFYQGFIALIVMIMTSAVVCQESSTETFTVKTKTGEIKIKIGDEITLETTSGDEISGFVNSATDQVLILKSKLGEIKIEISNIQEIEIRRKSDETSSQPTWRRSDPLSQRSFFSATGQTLKKGQKSYENYYLFFNSLNYGVTDNITVNAGMSLFPSDNFIKNNVYLVGVKGKLFDTGKMRFAVGAEYLTLPFKKADVSILYPFGVLGFGNPDNSQINISYSRIIYIAKNKDDDNISSLLNISGQLRISESIKFHAETFYPIEEKDVESVPYVYGIRFMSKKIAVDLGFMNTTDSEIFPGIPMISFCYTWK
jgi:hypothetical protein